jgi:hypothetical protein
MEVPGEDGKLPSVIARLDHGITCPPGVLAACSRSANAIRPAGHHVRRFD